MACGGCNDKAPLENRERPDEFRLETSYGAVITRNKCDKCTFKHLSYAYVALTEAEHGYPEHIALAQRALGYASLPADLGIETMRENLDAKARAVGHLVHAMEECPDRRLAEKIRVAYTAILDGNEAVDLLGIMEKINNDL